MSSTDRGIRLEVGILGPLRVFLGGEERSLAGEKPQALLARLAISGNRAVSSDRLIDELWEDEPPATARQSLHVHVRRVRRALSDDGAAAPLETTPTGYVLRLQPDAVDAGRFESGLLAARAERTAGRLEEASAAYAAALGLWRGEALEGFAQAWATAERGRLEALRLNALEESFELDVRRGRAVELLPELERLVDEHPLREGLHAVLMLALYAAGRQADALDAYQRARRALEELGLEPGPRLRELQAAILRQDPALTTAPLPSADAPLMSPRRRRALAVALTLLALVVVGAVLLAVREDAPQAARAPAVVVGPNSLVEIDPATNRVVSSIRVGSKPDSIAATTDAIWVANVGDRTVSRIDLATREVRVVGGAPVAFQLAGTLSGDVWLSSFEEPVVTLIARGGRVVEDVQSVAGAPRVELPGSAEGMGIGGGYLWVTSPSDSGGSDSVSQIDLRTRRLVASIPVGKIPAFTAFGYGSAWISNYRSASVSVVRPGSAEAETVTVADGPLGVAAGEGGVWVVSFWPRTLSRIDPETRRVVAEIRVGSGPLAVAAGAGAVWVTNRDDRTVSRIDPRTNTVSHTIRLAASPYGIRVAHGRVWVTTQSCGSPAKPC